MVVPLSELSSTQTEPPWRSAISHTRESPSPVSYTHLDLPAEQRIIHLQLRKQYRSLFYRLENPYSDTVRSIRIGEYHGYGLKNINRIVQENHGDFYTKKKDGVFTVQVRLNCEN